MNGKLNERLNEGMLLEERTKLTSVCQFPKNMLLEPTNICNNSCLFCANSKCTKKRGYIDKEFTKRILKDAYDLGTREVGFYGTGEPLLDKNLEEYIVYAKQLGYNYTYITTNGALLSKERAKSILDAGIDSVKFSINASNSKDYAMIHGKDEFDRIIENLIYFNTLRKSSEKKCALYISYVVTRYTEYDIEIFKDKLASYVDDIAFYTCTNVHGCMANEIRNYLSVRVFNGFEPKDGICPLIFKTFYITYDGLLTMCCSDFQNYLVIADLKKEKLSDAWNSKYAQELRRRHMENDLEGTLCYNCLNDCITNAKPLRQEYAVLVDMSRWDKSKEIEKRIGKSLNEK